MPLEQRLVCLSYRERVVYQFVVFKGLSPNGIDMAMFGFSEGSEAGVGVGSK